jgi:NADH dehydrogenase (ubiquinone) 1 alpha subcomplex subunit 13
LEEDESRTALQPVLEAEQDRLILWQIRRNRDEENALMKDVPGWVTGTWFGEHVYKSNPNFDVWINPTWKDIYPHTRNRDMERHIYWKYSYF